jgi:hypothetical protein
LRLLLKYPLLSSLPCEECHRHIYKIPTGVPDTYEGENGEDVLMKRPEGSPPPCDICPKGIRVGEEHVPDWEGRYTLRWENVQIVELWNRLKAPGYPVPEHLLGDGLFADRYATVDGIFNEVQRERENEMLSYELAKLIIR